MAVIKTKFKGTEIRCADMPHTNATLVTAPMLDGERVSIVIKGKQIANEVVKSKKILKDLFNELVAEQTLFRSLVGC